MKVIVIGGGPAGMMAAITAKNAGNDVIILEKMRSMGRKLTLTGKGRCNITNATDISNFISNVPGNGRFLYSVFNKYTNKDLIAFINSLGVKTKVERGERVFPVSDNALDVLNALKKYIDKLGISVIVNSKVCEIIVSNGAVRGVKTTDNKYDCDKVILATGGMSYPLTGSEGDGYSIVKKIGHTVASPQASLVGLETYEKHGLQGLSLKNVNVILKDENKIIYEEMGELLFTHVGISGPIILSSSSNLIRVRDYLNKMKDKKIKVVIDLKPALDNEKLDARLKRDFEKYTRKQFKNCLSDILPNKLIDYIIEKSGINPEKQIDQITKEERKNLVYLLKNLSFDVKCLEPIDQAVITAGGINIKEINSSTMESKIINGLYFAGEVIDVDAYTGGFNLQIAFSTGYVAGLLE